VNALKMARTAYSSASSMTRTDQATEYEVFGIVTSKIKKAITRKERNFSELAVALHDNKRLWAILAADVAKPSNGLPKQLRAQIIYLFEFVNLHTQKVLHDQASPDALIDINTSVMRGLRQQEISE